VKVTSPPRAYAGGRDTYSLLVSMTSPRSQLWRGWAAVNRPVPGAATAACPRRQVQITQGTSFLSWQGSLPWQGSMSHRTLILTLILMLNLTRGRDATQAPTTSPLLEGRWKLLFTTRPGTASPIQRSFTGVEAFSVFQVLLGLGCHAWQARNQLGSRLRLRMVGVDIKQRVISIGSNAARRFAGMARFPRQLPIKEGEHVLPANQAPRALSAQGLEMCKDCGLLRPFRNTSFCCDSRCGCGDDVTWTATQEIDLEVPEARVVNVVEFPRNIGVLRVRLTSVCVRASSASVKQLSRA